MSVNPLYSPFCWPFLYSWGGSGSFFLPWLPGGAGFYPRRSAPLLGYGGRTIPKQGDWVFLETGDTRSYGILADGSLWGWGEGPLGDGTLDYQPVPIKISSDQWISVSTSSTNTIAIKQDGTVWTWGSSSSHLGVGDSWPEINVSKRVILSSPIAEIRMADRPTVAHTISPASIVIPPFVRVSKSEEDDPGEGVQFDVDYYWSVLSIQASPSGWFDYQKGDAISVGITSSQPDDGDAPAACVPVVEYRLKSVEAEQGTDVAPDAVIKFSCSQNTAVAQNNGDGTFSVVSAGLYTSEPSYEIVGLVDGPLAVTFEARVVGVSVEFGGEYKSHVLSVSHEIPSFNPAVQELSGPVVRSCEVLSGGSGYTSKDSSRLSVSLVVAGAPERVTHIGEAILQPSSANRVIEPIDEDVISVHRITPFEISGVARGYFPSGQTCQPPTAVIQTWDGQTVSLAVARLGQTNAFSLSLDHDVVTKDPSRAIIVVEFPSQTYSVDLSGVEPLPKSGAASPYQISAYYPWLFIGQSNIGHGYYYRRGVQQPYATTGAWDLVDHVPDFSEAPGDVFGADIFSLRPYTEPTPEMPTAQYGIGAPGPFLPLRYLADGWVDDAVRKYWPEFITEQITVPLQEQRYMVPVSSYAGTATKPPNLTAIVRHHGGKDAEVQASFAENGDLHFAMSKSGEGYTVEPEFFFTSSVLSPVEVDLPSAATSVAATNVACAACCGGKVYVWGLMSDGGPFWWYGQGLFTSPLLSPAEMQRADVASQLLDFENYYGIAGVEAVSEVATDFNPAPLTNAAAYVAYCTPPPWTREVLGRKSPPYEILYPDFANAEKVFSDGNGSVFAIANGHLWRICPTVFSHWAQLSTGNFPPVNLRQEFANQSLPVASPADIALLSVPVYGVRASFDTTWKWRLEKRQQNVSVIFMPDHIDPEPSPYETTLSHDVCFFDGIEENGSSQWVQIGEAARLRLGIKLTYSGGDLPNPVSFEVRLTGGTFCQWDPFYGDSGSIPVEEEVISEPITVTETQKGYTEVLQAYFDSHYDWAFTPPGRPAGWYDLTQMHWPFLLPPESTDTSYTLGAPRTPQAKSFYKDFRKDVREYSGAASDLPKSVRFTYTKQTKLATLPGGMDYSKSFSLPTFFGNLPGTTVTLHLYQYFPEYMMPLTGGVPDLPSAEVISDYDIQAEVVVLAADQLQNGAVCLTQGTGGGVTSANALYFIKEGTVRPISSPGLEVADADSLSPGSLCLHNGRLFTLPSDQTSPLINHGNVEFLVVDGGKGFRSLPLIKTSPASESIASAEAEIDGSVVGVGVVYGGKGFTSPPQVDVDGLPSGSVSAVISGPVSTVEIISGGSGYRTPPRVVFSGAGKKASGYSVVDSQGRVQSVVVSQGGEYRSAPSVTFIPTSTVSSVLLQSGGEYESPPRIDFVGGAGSGAEAISVIDGRVYEIEIIQGGFGYTSPPGVFFTDGSAAAVAVVDAASGSVVSVSVTSAGSMYQSPPGVYFRGGGGSGCSAIAKIKGPVESINVTRGGEYEFPPRVVFLGGGKGAAATATLSGEGSGATASAIIDGSIIFCEVANAGSGYQFSPQVSCVPLPANNTIAKISSESGDAELLKDATPLLESRISGKIVDAEITSAGSGYSPGSSWTSHPPKAIAGDYPSPLGQPTDFSRGGFSMTGDLTFIADDQTGEILSLEEVTTESEFLQKPALSFRDSFQVTAESLGSARRTCSSLRASARSLQVSSPSPLNTFFVSRNTVFTNAKIRSVQLQAIRFVSRGGREFLLSDIRFDSPPEFEIADSTGQGHGVSCLLDQGGFVSEMSLTGSPTSPYSGSSYIRLVSAKPAASRAAVELQCSVSPHGEIVSISPPPASELFLSPKVIIEGDGDLAQAQAVLGCGLGFRPVESVPVTSRGRGYSAGTKAILYESAKDFASTEYGDAINEKLSDGTGLSYDFMYPEYVTLSDRGEYFPIEYTTATADDFLQLYSPDSHLHEDQLRDDPLILGKAVAYVDHYAYAETIETVQCRFDARFCGFFGSAPSLIVEGNFDSPPVLEAKMVEWASAFGKNSQAAAIRKSTT